MKQQYMRDIPLQLARPERFELPTTWFEARYSIQLSYGRALEHYLATILRVPASKNK